MANSCSPPALGWGWNQRDVSQSPSPWHRRDDRRFYLSLYKLSDSDFDSMCSETAHTRLVLRFNLPWINWPYRRMGEESRNGRC